MCLSAFFHRVSPSLFLWVSPESPAHLQAENKLSAALHRPPDEALPTLWSEMTSVETIHTFPVKFQVAHEIFKVLTRRRKMCNYVVVMGR